MTSTVKSSSLDTGEMLVGFLMFFSGWNSWCGGVCTCHLVANWMILDLIDAVYSKHQIVSVSGYTHTQAPLQSRVLHASQFSLTR